MERTIFDFARFSISLFKAAFREGEYTYAGMIIKVVAELNEPTITCAMANNSFRYRGDIVDPWKYTWKFLARLERGSRGIIGENGFVGVESQNGRKYDLWVNRYNPDDIYLAVTARSPGRQMMHAPLGYAGSVRAAPGGKL